MTSNTSEVLLKTVAFNGVEYPNAEVLSSKKIYNLLSEISKPPTMKKKFESQYASGDLPIELRTIYSIPLGSANEEEFFVQHFWSSVRSLFGSYTFQTLMLSFKIFGVQFNHFLEVIRFQTLMLSLV